MGEPLTRILLDTDLAMGAPGSDIDDGFALALAVADPGLALELVTTVSGNTDVATATRLSRELLDSLGCGDVQVVAGAPGPLAPRWRRPDRAGNPGPAVDWHSPDPHAATALARRVRAEPGELTVVAIGPLTNVALAVLLEPRFAASVREVVVMGGAYLEHTNVGWMPGEFNFWSDPDAAQVVLTSGAPLRLVGLDVTQQVRISREDAADLARGGGFGARAAEHTDAWIAFQEQAKPGDERERGSCALHDPLAVAVAGRRELVTWQPAHVTVETTSPTTRGVAVADLLRWDDPPAPNCSIATAVDVDAFRSMFLGLMAGLP